MPTSTVPARVVASTNEPFLGAEVVADGIAVDGVDIAKRIVPIVNDVSRADGREWTARDGAGEVRLTVTDTPCEDDMSAARYPFTAKLSIDGRSGRGCARPAGSPPPPVPDGG